jgi:tetratricopeptide (TPR) repeat protein
VIRGVGELRRGDYLGALKLFQRAYAVYASPKILFNLAQTYRELGRKVAALDAYERFLRDTPANTRKKLVRLARRRVQKLKSQLGTLRVAVSLPGAAILIDGQEVGLSPMDVPKRLLPGRHLVVVRREGYRTATATVTVRAGQRVTRRVRLRKPSSKVVVKRVVYRERRKPRKGWGVFWTGVGVTASLAVTLAVTGGITLHEQAVLDDDSRSVQRRLLAAERGQRYQWVNEGLLIAAGATAIFTTVWGLVVVLRSGGVERVPVPEPGEARAAPRPSASVRLRPAPGGLMLKGRF